MDKTYKKRDGTSGIRGQLYETKLISLIHFRAIFDDNIKDYHLATNVADIGTFDDICFRAKVKINNRYKSVAVFIQAKHREGENVQLTLNSKNDLAKWFSSYLTIRRLFKPNNKDVLFKGNFDEIECLFIMYTTAKDDLNNTPFNSNFAPILNSLIGTGNDGLQPCHKEEDIVFLCEIIMKEQFAALAEHVAKFLSQNDQNEIQNDENKNDKNKNDKPILSMNDELVLLYHVILVQKVFDVSEIRNIHEDDEHRIASFQKDFFDNDDQFIILFKNTLYIEMLKKRKLKETEIKSLIPKLFITPSDIKILGKLIGNVITFNNKKKKLEFISKSMPEGLKLKLDKFNILQSTVNEAIEFAAKEILISRQFKVPAAFGNKDLTIRGKEDVNNEPSIFIASTLDNLKNKMADLLHASQPDNIIVIDESVEKEFLQLNAGLAGAIGNILVCHENNKYMKFTDGELQGDLAKTLYAKVQSTIPNLHDFKFHIKVRTFPKLTFDCDDDEDLEMLKVQVTMLAEHLGKFLCKEVDSIMPMNDYVVLRYHIIVAQKVINVSEIQCRYEDEEHRLATFRQDFFENDDEFVLLFKKALYIEILKIRKIDENDIKKLLTMFFNKPSEITILSKLIGTVITYNNGNIEFINNNMSEDEKQQLEQVNVSQSTVDEAVDLAGKEILTSRQFKVPAAFGNKDLTIKIKKSKTERRLDHLKLKMSELINNSDPDKIVTLDESLGDGLLKLNGGIAGIVGNILVSEENTKLMKFTDNWESLGVLSRRLFSKLQTGIKNLHEYKFNVKVKKFPKLSFKRDEDDENLAKDFLKKLLFFTNQADEKDVEKLLKNEMETKECVNVNDVRVTADAIFLQYHDLIQKWWMLKEASYLTKQSRHYEDALALIVDKPLMTIISKMYMLKIKNIIDYTFNENAINSLQLKDQPSATIFVTENSAFTVAKMVQSLKKIAHFVFDVEYILDLQLKDYNTVSTELKNTDKNKIIIIVCNKSIHRNWYKRLENIANVLNDKRIIIITNDSLVKMMKTFFSRVHNTVTDGRCSLIQMSETSQKIILNNAKVIFQDVEVSLDSIIDENSMSFVEGEVLDKIINNEPIVLGSSNSNLYYEKVKHLYIDRRVIRFDKLRPNVRTSRNVGNVLLTLNDIANVALITAKPGMGKSTLLTHLSLKTKELNPKVWIVRINLLINSEKFRKWQENKTNIDYLETLKFIFEVILTEKQSKTNDLSIEMEESNGVVNLKSCTGDQWAMFKLKMFLDYYNRKELIFLFDGFDEICPRYTDEVLSLLKVVRNYPRKHKMWITSRSYDNVLSTLEQEFGNSYEIQHFTANEQDTYLWNFWKSKIVLRNLCKDQYNNLCNFMEFMTVHYHSFDINNQNKSVKKEKHQILFMKVCFNFLSYLRKEINVCPVYVIDTFNTLFSKCSHTIIFMEDFDTPLHLYLIAEYFQNQIKDVNAKPYRWNLDINAFTIYDTFIETKLKKIRFQEKNKIDLNIADNMIIYENVKADFFAKHYKLGAYAVFHQDADKIFSVKELREIQDTIDKIKEGTEKTGLIHSVANGIPTFIHMTFTEYFAVQYICDLLKTETRKEKQKSIWNFILNIVFYKCRENVRTVLGYKIKTDENLRAIVYEHEEIIFDLLLEQGKGVFTYYENDFSKYLFMKIKQSLSQAMADDLVYFAPLLFKLKEKLTEDYLKDLTRCTPRIKRLKFIHLIQKKQKAFYSRINNLQLTDKGISDVGDEARGPITVPWIDQTAGLHYSYRGGPSRPSFFGDQLLSDNDQL